MSATQAGPARMLCGIGTPSDSTAAAADLIFGALDGLHGLGDDAGALLSHAAAGLRLFQSAGESWTTEQELFRISLAGLGESDAVVVEAAACYAADLVACDPEAWCRVDSDGGRRALWFAAVLRLSEALCAGSSSAPHDVYAAWTDGLLYLEFDGLGLTEAQMARARARVAGIEALAGRHVILASSTERRGRA